MSLSRLFIVIVILLVAGCSGPERRPLLIYSPHGKEMLESFERQYELAHPDVDVQWLDMGSQDAYDRVRTERENPQADIWWGAPSTTFAKAEAESLLERYVPTWAGAVDSTMKSGAGFWYGTFITPEVIMYNNRVLTPDAAPQDWDDLLDPRWAGKIIIRAPLGSGTMRTIFAALISREEERHGSTDAGFQWLMKLDANTKSYVADPTQLYLKIAREEGLVTLWNLPDVLLQSGRNGYPFGYTIPRSGTPLLVDGIAIVRGTQHRADAEAFYEFVTSRDAMLQQAQEFGRVPARKDIPPEKLPAWLKALDLKPMHVNWQRILSEEKGWLKRWDEEVKGKGHSFSYM
jgi:iron(III) transport system substrate-binding protein